MLRFISIGNNMYEKQGNKFVLCASFKFAEDCEAVAESMNEGNQEDSATTTDQSELARV